MLGHQNQIIKSRANSNFCGLKELRDRYTPESNADFWFAALPLLQAEGLLPKWLSFLSSAIKMHGGAVSVLSVPCSVATKSKQPHVSLVAQPQRVATARAVARARATSTNCGLLVNSEEAVGLVR